MSDVKCPYCNAEQEINHDDGYGYDEDESHEQQCVSCDKTFKFTPSMSFSYKVECQEGDHDMQSFGDRFLGMYGCEKCDFFEQRGARPLVGRID